MKEIGDVAVVMGSGFTGPEGEELDRFGVGRIDKSVEFWRNGTVKSIIITGTIYPSGRSFITAAKKRLLEGKIPLEKIFSVENPEKFSPTTEGDIEQALYILRKEKFGKVFFITESPHWLFRIKNILKNSGTEAFHAKSVRAPWWFWAKEAIFLAVKPLGLYDFARRVWQGWLSPMYVESRSRKKK